jgi:magnesium and cobalt exporter, CNNM family
MTPADILSILSIGVLLALSAFFSGSETGLTAASRARIRRLAREGKKRAQAAAKLIEDRETLIGAILLGNNLVNVLAAALATGLLVSAFGPKGVALATAAMTVLIVVFSEVLPKTYAISRPDRVALAVAPLMNALISVFAPVVGLVKAFVRGLLRLLGVDVSKQVHVLSGREEIRGHIELQAEEGRLVRAHRYMLGSILDLEEVAVADVMVHRRNVFSLEAALPPEEIVRQVIESAFSRVPLWEGTRENIVGILNAKDLLKAAAAGGGDFSRIDVRSIATAPWFVPETTTLREQLQAFLREGRHAALVVDEYGALQGLLTLEDILEEIVGDIKDEYDPAFKGAKKLDDGAVLVDGHVTIRDLNRELDWRLPDDEAATIAGFVIHVAEMIPYAGQKVNWRDFAFEVMQRQKNQVTKIKITRRKKKGAK